MAEVREKPPAWFWIVSVLLLLWGLAGLFAFYTHASMSTQTLGRMSQYDRTMYLNLPGWFIWAFALATVPAVAGAVVLLMRSSAAIGLYVVSLIGIVIQFGWMFMATDLLAVKGAAQALPFPLLILALGVFSLWFAYFGNSKHWIS